MCLVLLGRANIVVSHAVLYLCTCKTYITNSLRNAEDLKRFARSLTNLITIV